MESRYLITAAFVLVACAIAATRPTVPTAAEIAREINGGDHFVYVRGDDGDIAANASEIRLWIEATGVMSGVSVFISPAEANRDYNNPVYWSLANLRYGRNTVYKGGVLMGGSIQPGDYIVEIAARNGSLVERLQISGSPLKQSIAVTSPEKSGILFSMGQ